PVHGLLQIDAGEAEIQSVQIVDLLGRQVLEQQFPSRGVNSVQIETGMLQPGIYVLKGKLRNHGLFVQKLAKR
ncbi:MAG: T9SS type A sorting domain-containing protein, partial [Lewinellaceae bacterium]|nr:T9SS type A sorting domain-containing protein [Lewinellaceae bacterium]